MKLLYFDCETTGLDPRTHALLEVAVAVADFHQPFRIGPIERWVLPVAADAYWAADDVVRDMHTKNGLWDACQVSTVRPIDVENRLMDLALVDDADKAHAFASGAPPPNPRSPTEIGGPHPDELCVLCHDRYGSTVVADHQGVPMGNTVCTEAKKRNKTTLAGSSVHFDLGFLRVHMPRAAGLLSHRVFDISSIKLFCRALGMPKLVPGEAHRAADDVQESVDHGVACLAWLGQRSLFPVSTPKGR